MIKGTIDSYELWQSRPENLNENMEDEIEAAENRGWNQCNRSWIKIIEEQPRVGEWTPCSLMLPKKHEHVLMTWKCGEYYHTTEAVYEDNGWLHYCPKNLPSDIEVIAWMPLPEPYKISN